MLLLISKDKPAPCCIAYNINVPLHSTLHCAEWFMCRVCFHIHLLKVGTFSVLIENPILSGGPMSMICDITNYMEAYPGPVFNLHKCDVET